MVIKNNLNAFQRQKLVEGLKELAAMIATSYRRRVSGETDIEPLCPANYEATLVSEEDPAQCLYPGSLCA